MAALARICAALGLLIFGPTLARSDTRSEYQIKAAFLINFGSFVEWPDYANATPDRFTLCVFGRDPFGAILDDAAAGKTISGRTLATRRVTALSELRFCQTVFLPASDMYRFDQITASLKGLPVLTVGEAKGFALRGGHINFVMQEDRVRFEISPSAAARAHLRISSRLLGLAIIVGGESTGARVNRTRYGNLLA
jgi:YfiR/HmsC-like